MSPKLHGAQLALLQNFAGHRLTGPKLCGVQVEGSKIMQPVPHGISETWFQGPAQSLKLSKILIVFLIIRLFLLTSDILEIYTSNMTTF